MPFLPVERAFRFLVTTLLLAASAGSGAVILLPQPGDGGPTGAFADVQTLTLAGIGEDADESPVQANAAHDVAIGGDTAGGTATANFPDGVGGGGTVGASSSVVADVYGGTATSVAFWTGDFIADSGAPGSNVDITISIAVDGSLSLTDNADSIDPLGAEVAVSVAAVVDDTDYDVASGSAALLHHETENFGSELVLTDDFLTAPAGSFVSSAGCAAITQPHACTVDVDIAAITASLTVIDGEVFTLLLSMGTFAAAFGSGLGAVADFPFTASLSLDSVAEIHRLPPTVGAAVSEPAVLALLLAGLAGLRLAPRRRGARTAA